MKDEEMNIISCAKTGKKSLLERYNIPVEHLSYEYISECSNAKILEHIVMILRSGEEGVYPDLTRHAEERLAVIKPTSVILRKSEPVCTRNMLEPSERKEIENDIDNWVAEMQYRERDLEEGKATLISGSLNHGDIRQIKEEVTKKSTTQTSSNKSKRISSCDYAAWDKYDADTELNKIDIHEEQRQAAIKKLQRKQKELNENKKSAKSATIEKSSLTGTELEIMAEQEREKGNEAFRAGDYEEALEHYNSSIKVDSNVTAFNNRAMTFIKLRRYEDALTDCNLVLSSDYMNIKALLRRAVSLEHLEKPSQALADYEAVLKLEPTNKTAIEGVKKLRKSCGSRKVRMAIEEREENAVRLKPVETEENSKQVAQFNMNQNIKSNICFCDRAPGPSQNLRPRPHLKADYCLENENRQKPVIKNDTTDRVKWSVEKMKSDSCVKSQSPKTSAVSSNTSTLPPKISDATRETSNFASTKQKSIFCYSTPPSRSVIIEELPNESCDNNTTVIKNKSNQAGATKSGRKNSKHKSDNKELLSSMEAKSSNKNKIQFDNSHEKYEGNHLFQKKIQVAEKFENKTSKADNNVCKKFNNVESPYEFTRVWQTLKNDKDLRLHAELLRTLNIDNLRAVIGNKLDGTMFSTIVRCLEKHFCTPNDLELLCKFLKSFSQVHRFSIVMMFMDAEDKKIVGRIFNFLEEQRTSDVPSLREVYCIQ